MLEKAKAELENFVKENGLSSSMMRQKVQEIYNEISEKDLEKPEDERLSENAKHIRAYRRARYAFKKEARSLQNGVEGMIVCRYLDSDFVRNTYRYCMQEMEKNRDEALAQGLINEQGKPMNKYSGEELDLSQLKPYGQALGYIMVENEEGVKIPQPKLIKIHSRNSEDNIPVCQLGKLAVNDAKKKQENFRYSNSNNVWYNAAAIDDGQKAPYTESELTMILTQWSQAFDTDEYVVPKIKTFEELEAFKNEFISKKRGDEHSFDFCFAPMIVQGISEKKNNPYSDVAITLQLIEDTQYIQTINTFMVPEQTKGLKIEEGLAGIAVLQAYDYKKSKSDPQWHLGGFLAADEEVDVAKFFE